MIPVKCRVRGGKGTGEKRRAQGGKQLIFGTRLPAVPLLHASFAYCLLHMSSLKVTEINCWVSCLNTYFFDYSTTNASFQITAWSIKVRPTCLSSAMFSSPVTKTKFHRPLKKKNTAYDNIQRHYQILYRKH